MTARRPYGWRPGLSPGWLLRSRNPRTAYAYGISHHDPASWWTTVVVQSILLGSGGYFGQTYASDQHVNDVSPWVGGVRGKTRKNTSYDSG